MSRPNVTATYTDYMPTNSYSIYANARFSQYRQDCVPRRVPTCIYSWFFVQQVNGPNTTGTTTQGFNGTLSGKSGQYGVNFTVCADVPWRSDPCATSPRATY